MLSITYLRIAEHALLTIVAVAFLTAVRAERQDRAQLAVELAQAKQALAAADSRQHDRDTQLAHTLSNLAAQKRDIVTPNQILHALPQLIPLPTPITAAPAAGIPPPTTAPDGPKSQIALGSKPKSNMTSPQAVIPTEDLKPLYDFAIDCQACQTKLAASQANLTDERIK